MAKTDNIGRDLAAAPLGPLTEQHKPVTNAHQMPEVKFRLVGNPKAYQDKQDASKSTARLAYVDFVSGPLFQLSGSIYLETKIMQQSDGRHEVKALRFSLMKGLELRADLPTATSTALDQWKDQVVDAYIAWRKDAGAIVAGPKATAGYRTIE